MHVAICDDNLDEIFNIYTILDDFCREWNYSITYEVFHNATDLLERIKVKVFDLLLMDILMPGINGITAAKEIRTTDQNIPIIFLTSSREFAVESYRVDAFDYIMKPIRKDEIYPSLHKLITNLTQKETYLTVKTGRSISKLPISQIVYVEVINRSVEFRLANGDIKETYGYLTEYEDVLLAEPNFYKPHRSYLVNLRYVTALDKNGFSTTLGKIVPVARDSFTRSKSIYMKYLLSSNDRSASLC